MRTKYFSALVLMVGVSSLMLACGSKSNPMLGPKPTVQPSNYLVDTSTPEMELANPQVDVLFVVDDSASMDAHIRSVQANMDRFAEEFLAHANVDFHVGLVKVFDSTRYGVTVSNFVPNGQLQGGMVVPGGKTVDELKTLLNFNTKELKDGGPEIEESLSPIKAALTEPNLSGANKGFYRPGANLAVIIITDADDASPNIGNMTQFLLGLKGGNASKISVNAAIAYEGSRCSMDPSGPPQNIVAFLKDLSSHGVATSKMPVCSSQFGDELAHVGHQIVLNTLANARVVELSKYPDVNQITVSYAGVILPQGAGWRYDCPHNSIELKPDFLKFAPGGQFVPGAQIQVGYKVLENQELARACGAN